MFQSHCKWSRQFICFIRVSKVFIGYDVIIAIRILKNWIIRFEDQPTCNRQQSHRHRRNKRIVKRNIYLFAWCKFLSTSPRLELLVTLWMELPEEWTGLPLPPAPAIFSLASRRLPYFPGWKVHWYIINTNIKLIIHSPSSLMNTAIS